MELILKQDIQNLGFKNDLVTVKNGYGRNFLIPSGKAILATPSAKKVLQEDLKQKAFKEKKIVEEAKDKASKIQELEIKILSKVGSGTKLFGSVSNQDVADKLKANDIILDKKFISIPGKMIKRLGTYEASIRLHREVVITKSFDVVAEAK